MPAISTPEALAQLAGPQAGAVWSVLVERFGLEVWRLMASRVRDAHEAEDAYQEFWLALPHNARRFRAEGADPERSARAWIMRVAYVAAACRRTRRGVPLGVTMQPLDPADGTGDGRALAASPALAAATAASDEDRAERARLLGRVHEAIGGLPEGYRRPLLLHVVGGLSYEELAGDLRCTVNYARVKVHRGLKRLRDLLGVREAELPDHTLMGLFVPLLPFTAVAPPLPGVATGAAKKLIAKKLLLRHEAAAGGAVKAALVAAVLVVAAGVAVQAALRGGHGVPAPVARPQVAAPVAAAAPPAPLDGLPASSAAYGLRRLRRAWAGAAVLLRSGAQERDIGFTAAGALDEAAARALCGAGDGCVVRWYDQSGRGDDLVQAVPARQPRLVVGGALQTIGGRPALRIAAAEEWLDATGQAVIGSATALLRSARAGTYSDWQVVLASSTTYDRRYFRGEIDHDTFDAVGPGPSVFHVDGRRTARSAPLERGKVVTAELPAPIAGERLRLGNDCYQVDVRGWGGLIAEVVVFPTVLAPQELQVLTRAEQGWLAGEVTAGR